jgi:hypothetical protein
MLSKLDPILGVTCSGAQIVGLECAPGKETGSAPSGMLFEVGCGATQQRSNWHDTAQTCESGLGSLNFRVFVCACHTWPGAGKVHGFLETTAIDHLKQTRVQHKLVLSTQALSRLWDAGPHRCEKHFVDSEQFSPCSALFQRASLPSLACFWSVRSRQFVCQHAPLFAHHIDLLARDVTASDKQQRNVAAGCCSWLKKKVCDNFVRSQEPDKGCKKPADLQIFEFARDPW